MTEGSENKYLQLNIESEDSEHTTPSESDVYDEAGKDDLGLPEKYEITSFGADYDVDGIVKRIGRGDIIIPEFQREYVWTQSEASRFIESLLLGLPVPGVFFAKESESGKFQVIDGQQRLRSLEFFYSGYFNPSKDSKKRTVFTLQKVQRKYEGLTYEDLEDKDRRTLDDSIIHATIVKQDSPEDDNTSIYHVFERLNNGGQRLTAQEIRSAIYHGNLLDAIRELNSNEHWRNAFGGRKNRRLKDQELILRFLALYFGGEKYERPMKEFLNRFAKKHIQASDQFIESCKNIFLQTIRVIDSSIERPFRPERALNTAVLDSVMVGLARRISAKGEPDVNRFKASYTLLLENSEYLELISRATSNEANVNRRIELSEEAFSGI
ncbi:MAG: DUF262 domain-containing protein [Shackletoniella antarctica]|jgi:hypothetical protein|uniref:DUF262 domain-containing protein n=1 Tax=Shackletoniella antarctica TaxID=268115 RepID=A0A2W4WFN6_9CYAN|nr:MAG: DUF262 domain-containing protein [Shackletoniella antarctica]